MATHLTPGPGLECVECGETSAVSEAERRIGDCPSCGEYAIAVEITTCEDSESCNDETHDFGSGFHIRELEL